MTQDIEATVHIETRLPGWQLIAGLLAADWMEYSKTEIARQAATAKKWPAYNRGGDVARNFMACELMTKFWEDMATLHIDDIDLCHEILRLVRGKLGDAVPGLANLEAFRPAMEPLEATTAKLKPKMAAKK
jgi:hypothetical protein